MANSTPITVIDRETGKAFHEKILGEKWIRWAYQDGNATTLESLLFRSSLISTLMGWWYDSPFSKGKIDSAIHELEINEWEFASPKESYGSFNEFFARHLKDGTRPFDPAPENIVSPADGRVLVFPKLDEDTFAPVKGHPFNIRKMLPVASEHFINGSLAIIRLCPADYHRYHFPCAGKIVQSRDFAGALHSVNPIALGSGPDVFGENKRSYTMIQTPNIGTYCYVEVGAFGVGSIINTKTDGSVQKMEEKGYFKFGGSTVVLVFEQNKIRFSEDLIANSAAGHETLIKVGQPLASAIEKTDKK
ncbi:archaetidylserine decarboxylase [Terasakiella sp. SH-1]|uniref:archaetidylserine decarboxylase n=1 Tax=Terasakiella sp. SH-1 TaxID=2560057 RepID=UPI001073285E|nr:archaetidylserine decarboxylase [Terasakiella sp. SH-1]